MYSGISASSSEVEGTLENSSDASPYFPSSNRILAFSKRILPVSADEG